MKWWSKCIISVSTLQSRNREKDEQINNETARTNMLFIESWNGKVGRDHWRSSGSTSLLKQDPLDHITQGHVESDFEYLQRMSFHNLCGQPVNFCESCKRMNLLNNQTKSIGFLVLLIEERYFTEKTWWNVEG